MIFFFAYFSRLLAIVNFKIGSLANLATLKQPCDSHLNHPKSQR